MHPSLSVLIRVNPGQGDQSPIPSRRGKVGVGPMYQKLPFRFRPKFGHSGVLTTVSKLAVRSRGGGRRHLRSGNLQKSGTRGTIRPSRHRHGGVTLRSTDISQSTSEQNPGRRIDKHQQPAEGDHRRTQAADAGDQCDEGSGRAHGEQYCNNSARPGTLAPQ